MALTLRRPADGGVALFDQLLARPEIARTGLAEADATLADLVTDDADVWAVVVRDREVGLTWLDRCFEHPEHRDCALFLARRGLAPRVMVALFVYARLRLGADGLCFETKAYNWTVLASFDRVGVTADERAEHHDDFHPAGASELVGYVTGAGDLERNLDRARAWLRAPVEFHDRDGEVEYVVSADLL